MTTGITNDKASGGNISPSHRKEQTLDVFVFLFLIIPSTIISFFVLKQGGMTFVLIALSTILRDLALIRRLYCGPGAFDVHFDNQQRLLPHTPEDSL